MLAFERRVVAALTTAHEPGVRARVEAFVDGSLSAMPEHLRAGVVAGSVALASWARARHLVRPVDDAALVRSLESSPVAPVRQYVRLLRSLVLFAEQELAEPAA